jgi:endonuclease III
MSTAKRNPATEVAQALRALKQAIVEGATWRYEHLIAVALKAGATDEQIDATAHSAIEALFASAEQPVTPRQLAHIRHAGQFRR